ncbi:MAG: peptidoglycan DD-metalloendopeptidase family protein [Parasphingorhabdus sp.]|nr:peptidoglycan DD-metalloendopeptidase family protein [Parasphingorhabdus sp.]
MRRLLLFTAASALIVLSLGDGNGFAQTAMAPTLADEQRALVKARRDADKARQRNAALIRQAEAATGKAERQASEAAALAERIIAAKADIAAARARIAIVSELQQRQTERLAEKRAPLMRLTAALQAMTRRPPAIALFQPQSLDDVVHVRAVMASAVPEIRRQTAGLRDEIAQSRQLQVQAAQAVASLSASQALLADRMRELSQLEAQNRSSATRLISDAGREEDRVLALGEDVRDILDSMNRITDMGQVRNALSQLPAPALRTRDGQADMRRGGRQRQAYMLPVTGDVVAGLGEISASGYRARGLTIKAAAATAVVAPAAGRVVFAGPYKSYGDIVIINHGSGWTSLITGLAGLDVKTDALIGQGDRIGLTVRAEQNVPLNVELRRNGRPMDIAALIG